jgi:hypothetical protein
MKYVSHAAAVLVLFLAACAHMDGGHGDHGSPSGVPAYAGEVNWHSLAEGQEMARSMKKPLLVDFAVPSGCDRCDFLQDNVYSVDEIVAKINRDFIPVFINLDASSHTLTPEEKRLGLQFDYRNDCLLLFLGPEGRIIKDPDGKEFCFAEEIEPEVFMDHLDYVRMKYTPAD